MDKLEARPGASTRDETYDNGIRDLQAVVTSEGVAVYATSGSYGGLSGYRLDAQDRLVQIHEVTYTPTQGAGLATELSLVNFGNGDLRIVVGGTGAGRLISYDVNVFGQISGPRFIEDVDASFGAIGVITPTQDGLLLANPWDSGFTAFALNGNRLTTIDHVRNTGDTLGLSLRDVVVLERDGTEYYVSASQGFSDRGWSSDATGLTAYEMRAGEARPRDTLSASDGLGLMVPTDMTVAQVGGQQYAVVASASPSGQAGTLSIVGLTATGGLRLIDHVGDTRDTRFASAQAVESITHDGRAYVVAGGVDDGVSLFALSPSGTLILLDSFANTAATGLDGVTALELVAHDQQLHIFAASQSDAGVSHLTFDVSGQGRTQFTPQSGGTTSGTGGDDIIEGRAGNDLIIGRNGDDILSDGAGQDTLRGGVGADVFVFSDDQTRDRIDDFDIRQDQIDLSSWAFFTDPDDLVLQRINGGVRITYYREHLDVMQGDNPRITFEALRDAVMASLNRVFEIPSQRLDGGGGADLLEGEWAADTLSGGAGNDTLRGGAGDDRLDGGSGQDLIEGGTGIDTALMHVSQRTVSQVRQLGDDRVEVTTARGVDIFVGVEVFVFSDGTLDFEAVVNLNRGLTLTGTTSNNRMTGDTGHDRLYGGDGRDTLNGQAGNDILNGGQGNDSLIGGSGTDRAVLSVSQDEILQVIRLSSSSVQLSTADGQDTLDGVEQFQFTDGVLSLAEILNLESGRIEVGNATSNTLTGGQGADTLSGFGGNDKLTAGAGEDLLRGGSGSDRLSGQSGRDTLSGGSGNDTVDGGGGTDVAEVGATLSSIRVRTFSDGRIEIRSPDGTDIFESVEFFALNDAYLSAGQIRALSDGTVNTGPGEDPTDTGSPGISRTGGSGNDSFIGTNNNDTLNGRGGDDFLNGSAGKDILDGGTGDDSIRGGVGDDRIVGGWGEDTLAGGKGNDVIFGGPSENQIVGQAGSDTLYGGNRNDTIKGGGAADLMEGDEGDDFLKGGTRNDTVKGGKGDDLITGNRHADNLAGGRGRDFLNGGGDNDTLDGGAGADTLKGGTGSDDFIFEEGDGRDRILDFDHRRDILNLESDLLAGQRNGNAVLNAYASATGNGIVLDFGGGDTITLEGLRNLSLLSDNIEIF